jgi:hypothetical protein
VLLAERLDGAVGALVESLSSIDIVADRARPILYPLPELIESTTLSVDSTIPSSYGVTLINTDDAEAGIVTLEPIVT